MAADSAEVEPRGHCPRGSGPPGLSGGAGGGATILNSELELTLSASPLYPPRLTACCGAQKMLTSLAFVVLGATNTNAAAACTGAILKAGSATSTGAGSCTACLQASNGDNTKDMACVVAPANGGKCVEADRDAVKQWRTTDANRPTSRRRRRLKADTVIAANTFKTIKGDNSTKDVTTDCYACLYPAINSAAGRALATFDATIYACLPGVPASIAHQSPTSLSHVHQLQATPHDDADYGCWFQNIPSCKLHKTSWRDDFETLSLHDLHNPHRTLAIVYNVIAPTTKSCGASLHLHSPRPRRRAAEARCSASEMTTIIEPSVSANVRPRDCLLRSPACADASSQCANHIPWRYRASIAIVSPHHCTGYEAWRRRQLRGGCCRGRGSGRGGG